MRTAGSSLDNASQSKKVRHAAALPLSASNSAQADPPPHEAVQARQVSRLRTLADTPALVSAGTRPPRQHAHRPPTWGDPRRPEGGGSALCLNCKHHVVENHSVTGAGTAERGILVGSPAEIGMGSIPDDIDTACSYRTPDLELCRGALKLPKPPKLPHRWASAVTRRWELCPAVLGRDLELLR